MLSFRSFPVLFQYGWVLRLGLFLVQALSFPRSLLLCGDGWSLPFLSVRRMLDSHHCLDFFWTGWTLSLLSMVRLVLGSHRWFDLFWDSWTLSLLLMARQALCSYRFRVLFGGGWAFPLLLFVLRVLGAVSSSSDSSLDSSSSSSSSSSSADSECTDWALLFFAA